MDYGTCLIIDQVEVAANQFLRRSRCHPLVSPRSSCLRVKTLGVDNMISFNNVIVWVKGTCEEPPSNGGWGIFYIGRFICECILSKGRTAGQGRGRDSSNGMDGSRTLILGPLVEIAAMVCR